MDNSFEQVIAQLPQWFREIADSVPFTEREKITELRIFLDRAPLWTQSGIFRIFHKAPISRKQLDELFYAVCRGSVHSFQQEICQGYVTMEGGHRAGICGTAIFQNGVQTGLRDISSMNIRFARERRGCGAKLFREMKKLGLEQGNFLLAGAPGSGKTTILRDYARLLADSGCVVAVLDERGELSGFDLGYSTHVLKNLPKERAILQAVRTLAPQVILCDEIGREQEAELLCQGLNSGCHFIASIHGNDLKHLLLKQQLRPLLEQRTLDAVVLLEPLGKIRRILTLEEFYETDGLRNGVSMRASDGTFSSPETGGESSGLAGIASLLSTNP